MRRLCKLVRLLSEWGLLLRAALLLAATRLGLELLPFHLLRRMLPLLTRGRFRLHPAPWPACRLAWAMRVAARYVPGASCLAQSLSLQVLLARNNHSARVRVGVVRPAGAQLEAHAWVEQEGTAISGGLEPGVYTPLSGELFL